MMTVETKLLPKYINLNIIIKKLLYFSTGSRHTFLYKRSRTLRDNKRNCQNSRKTSVFIRILKIFMFCLC